MQTHMSSPVLSEFLRFQHGTLLTVFPQATLTTVDALGLMAVRATTEEFSKATTYSLSDAAFLVASLADGQKVLLRMPSNSLLTLIPPSSETSLSPPTPSKPTLEQLSLPLPMPSVDMSGLIGQDG
jgi:hypothetical protein